MELTSLAEHPVHTAAVEDQCSILMSAKPTGAFKPYLISAPHSAFIHGQYTADPLVCEYVCVRECLSALESQCGSGASLRSLLHPGGASLSKAQLNQRLAWSHSARPGTRTRPPTPQQEQAGPQKDQSGPGHTR